MFDSLVITLREGIEAALVVGIILVYLNRAGLDHLKRNVYLGLGLAVAASIALAIVFQALRIDPENEYLEGTFLGIAGVMVATLVVFMWRASRNIKADTEKRLGEAVTKTGGSNWGGGLVALTFFMVFREGAETVLFLMSATLGRFDMASVFGGVVGTGLAVMFAVFFIRGSLRINLSRFFAVTSVVLLALALKLLLGSVHEFAEVGALPLNATVMATIGYFVRDRSSTIIVTALLVIPLLVVLWSARAVGNQATQGETSSVERRKQLAAKRQERVWKVGLVGVSVLIAIAMGSTVMAESGMADPVPTPLPSADGQVNIPASLLVDGQLTKFTYSVDGTDVRFMAFPASDGSVAVALDACQICGAKGYGQDGDRVVCKRCNAPIAANTIGQGGGCNPLPLKANAGAGLMTISVADIANSVAVFK